MVIKIINLWYLCQPKQPHKNGPHSHQTGFHTNKAKTVTNRNNQRSHKIGDFVQKRTKTKWKILRSQTV